MEVEIKLALQSAAEASAIAAALGGTPAADVRHTNIYFDDDAERWRAAGFAIRLRLLPNAAVLTVKVAQGQQGGFVARGEWERAVANAAEVARGGAPLAEALLDLLAAHPSAPRPSAEMEPRVLMPLGSIVTWRRSFALGGLTIELDETRYPDDSIDWEVELELGPDDDAESATAALQAVFARAGVPWRVSVVSKQARFRRCLPRD